MPIWGHFYTASNTANASPVEIHIHAAPSQSANDIAREVAKQLELIQRREQARQLSRYQDREDY